MSDWISKWRVQFLVIALGFLFLLFYEAAQQYYYITTFDLAKGQPIFFHEVLFGQLKKWLVWIILAIPFILYVRNFPLPNNQPSFSQFGRYFAAILIMLFINIAVLSVVHIFTNELNFNSTTMGELMTFYTFQKGPIYILAYIGVIGLVHLFLNHNELELKVRELSELKKSNHSLYEELVAKSVSESSFTINVKIGNKMKPILLDEINWIEADDYCVKLHLKDTSYTQRSSMKSLEKLLPENQFLRVHRKSIVNINSIDEFQFKGSPYIRLKNGRTLDIAQSRLKEVRQILTLNSMALAH